jgi:uncharacterized protein YbjT (DUF2867 family)
MKIVVIGGSGLIGKKLVKILSEHGHEAVPASPATGVDTLTGQGLADVLKGAQVVVDVTNSPSFEDTAVMKFFETSTHNLLSAEAKAGVKHHVALSIVGADRNPDSGYLRAKVAQERLIKASAVPYSILRATQFFEFAGGITDSATEGNTVCLTLAKLQPIAADDVAAALAPIAMGEPINGMVEVAGPDAIPLAEIAQRWLAAKHDKRQVVVDNKARYFGAELNDKSLTPGANPRIGKIRFDEWLNRSVGVAA